MAKNYVEAGHRKSIVLTAAAVSGVPMAVGSEAGIPITSGAIGDEIAVALTGVWDVPTSATLADGDLVDFDIASGEAVATTTGDFALGVAYKADSDGTVDFLLNNKPGMQKAP